MNSRSFGGEIILALYCHHDGLNPRPLKVK